MFKNLGHNANDRICLFSSLARLRQVGLEKPPFVPIFKPQAHFKIVHNI